MRHRFLPLGALVASLAVLAAACGSSAPFAATVDGRSISQDGLESELRSIAANEAYVASIEAELPVRGSGQGTFDAAFTAEVLSRQILYSLVRAEVARRDLRVGDAELVVTRPSVAAQAGGEEVLAGFSNAYQDLLVRRAAEVNVLTVSLIGQASADEAARTYYQQHSAEFAKACVSHILVDKLDVAGQLKARIDAGEDFGVVARSSSQDALTAAQGGSLGCDITPDTPFVPEFLSAVFSQPVGAVGSPVQSSFGFHVIKVSSRDVPAYEQVAAEANQKVVQSGQGKLREWLEAAIEGADVGVNPKYGTYHKAGVDSGVTPPQAPLTVPSGGPTATTAPPPG